MRNVTNALIEHVGELAGRIGTRYVGSPGNLAARNYIQREMERAGLAVDIQESDCPEWSAREAVLEIEGIRRQAFVNPFSAPVDVTADR
jgi:hypothetical protein